MYLSTRSALITCSASLGGQILTEQQEHAKALAERLEAEKESKRPGTFPLVRGALQPWERMRGRDVGAKERADAIKEVLAKCRGKYVDLCKSHAASRVLQTCVGGGNVARWG